MKKNLCQLSLWEQLKEENRRKNQSMQVHLETIRYNDGGRAVLLHFDFSLVNLKKSDVFHNVNLLVFLHVSIICPYH